MLMARLFAEAALTLLKRKNSFFEFFGTEVRPESVGKIELGIGHLPKKKIGKTEFAAGTDD